MYVIQQYTYVAYSGSTPALLVCSRLMTTYQQGLITWQVTEVFSRVQHSTKFQIKAVLHKGISVVLR